MIKIENESIKKLSQITKKLKEIKSENTQLTTLEAFQQASQELKNQS
jgi:hypothetical protein